MSLTPYTISDHAKRAARRSGFDIDNPDQRHPVQNPQIEQVMLQRNQQLDPRARLLLKGRQTLDRFRGKERSK